MTELRGIPCIELEEAPPDRKSIMASRSFGKMVTIRHELEEVVATFTTRAAEKLRRQHLAAGRLVVFVMTDRFRPQDAQYGREQTVELPVASSDTGKLIAAAERGLAKIWRKGFAGRSPSRPHRKAPARALWHHFPKGMATRKAGSFPRAPSGSRRIGTSASKLCLRLRQIYPGGGLLHGPVRALKFCSWRWCGNSSKATNTAHPDAAISLRRVDNKISKVSVFFS